MAGRLEARGSEKPRAWAQMDSRATDDLPPEASESFSEEVRSSSSLSSPGGPLPSPPVSGDKPESGKPPAHLLEYQDKRSELPEERFSRKRIDYLKGKETNTGGHPPDTQPPSEVTPVSDEQTRALQAFCSLKVNLMHRRATSKGKKRSRHQKPQLRSHAEAPEVDAARCTAPDELLNRMHLKNVMATLKQAAAVKQHVPSRCPDCIRKRAELAQSAFLKRKKTLLETLLLQEKIDERLHTKDFLTFIGEAHRGLPRLSDDPRIIWKRLNEKSQKRDWF
uniref:Uncharacterized protein n=1 Tax=Pipistrellus kuhlii TaxID=59472 RepID=A0A7J7ZGD0_PIPKU|nr:hypothetical protein mPipKuh1_001894 [Pipistrellus kuhlii]